MKLLSRVRSTPEAKDGVGTQDAAVAAEKPTLLKKLRLGKKKEPTAAGPTDYTKKLKRKKLRKIIVPIAVCVVLIIGALAGFRYFKAQKSSTASTTTYTTYTAEKRDISVTLSGSGTLEPADSYSVTSLASGEILSDSFEEGDMVEKDDVLYQIDTADAETSIRSAELNLEKAQLSYNNLLESLGNLM